MNKKVLSEISINYGEVKLPEKLSINQDQFIKDILLQESLCQDFPFSKNWDLLNTYIKDYFNLKNDIQIAEKKTWGDIYKSKEGSFPLIQVDPQNLRDSPDFVLLYGVKIKKDSCFIRIYYDNNRQKGKAWDMPINTNTFLIFPSTLKYVVSPNISDDINYIQTITYTTNESD